MCYSEPLSREDSGYMEAHGYVLVGWKIVMPWSADEIYPDGGLTPCCYNRCIHTEHPFMGFPPRKITTDPTPHGFHVASTIESAQLYGGKLCRVLVPEHAVRPDHHVDALMVIPPGEKETPEDIAACDAWNAQHMPMESKEAVLT